MSHDVETELWNLWFELDQMQCATHYYSDLKPTAENYKDQWQYFCHQSDQVTEIFNRLSAHLEAIGFKQTAPDMGIGDDEIPF